MAANANKLKYLTLPAEPDTANCYGAQNTARIAEALSAGRAVMLPTGAAPTDYLGLTARQPETTPDLELTPPPDAKPAKKPAKHKALKLTAPRIPEKVIQSNIVGLLRACGYVVLQLGQRRKPVLFQEANGRWQKRFQAATMNDTSTPDMVITSPHWGRNVWHMVEVKGPGTERRPGQVALVEAGLSVFITSDRDAAADVLAFERQIGAVPNARLIKWVEATP